MRARKRPPASDRRGNSRFRAFQLQPRCHSSQICTVATNRNSSQAALQTRSRRWSSMRFRCANSVSTLFRCLCDRAYRNVFDSCLATSRADSLSCRAIVHIGVLGQYCISNGKSLQSLALAR